MKVLGRQEAKGFQDDIYGEALSQENNLKLSERHLEVEISGMGG